MVQLDKCVTPFVNGNLFLKNENLCGLFMHSLLYYLLLTSIYSGKVREKFPLEMAEIQGAVVAADINDDGKIELVTTDVHGNVAAWTSEGKEIWEQHVKSLVPQASLRIFTLTLYVL